MWGIEGGCSSKSLVIIARNGNINKMQKYHEKEIIAKIK